jgi:hypothetical protein
MVHVSLTVWLAPGTIIRIQMSGRVLNYGRELLRGY